jgi:hypothetical protein
MSEPVELWTTGDMGRALGLTPGYAANWGMPGHRRIPAPHAKTPAGLKLYTAEQAREIMAGYVADRDARAARRADRERAARAVARLTEAS